jgi:hypothetical protein
MTGESPSSDWLNEVRRKLASDNIGRAFEASISLLRWVLTSTALLHSTALIAAFNSNQFARVMFAGPAWFFIAGIALTSASGIIFAYGAADLAGKMSQALWSGSDLTGETPGAYDPEANVAVLCGSILLGLSVAALVLGIVFSGIKIAQMPAKERVEASQRT